MSRRRPAWMIAFAGFASGLFTIAFFSSDVRLAVSQPKALVIAAAPQAPTLAQTVSLGAKVGETIELTLVGTNLNDPVAVMLSGPGKVSIPTDNKNGTDPAKLRVKVELPADCPIGLHTIRVATKQGVSNFRPFIVDELTLVPEVETNRTKDTAQVVAIPAVVAGRTDPEVSDFFKVKIAPGQTVTFEVVARRIGSPLDPIVVLHDAKTKRELVDLYADDTPGLQSDCRLTHTFKDGGEFLVEVRDTTYRGGGDYFYRLRMGEFPGVTTAFPVAAQRGQTVNIGFAGPGSADIAPVSVKAPADPTLAAVYVSPKKTGGIGGWPVAVRLSDSPELAEAEPNDEPAKANKLPVPGGVTGRFEKTGDLDHFAVTCKKGVKYAASAMTFEINSPCEVLIRVQDAKGKEVARSNPTQSNARAEFTPETDGEYIIACEQLNFLSGPNEVYHLAVSPVTADFNIALAFDRGEAPVGGGTAIAATVNRLNGYAGPVELSIVGDAALSGKTMLPAGQTVAFVPLMVKDGTKPGAYAFRVQGQVTVNGQTVVRVGTLVDTVKATLGGLPNPPAEMLSGCAVAVVEKAPFTVKMTAEPASIEKGKAGKVVFEVVRGEGADGDIAIAPLFVAPNVTPAAAKPIAKGTTKTELGLTVTPATIVGPTPFVFRATTKIGGKDYALTPPPLMIDITEPKKDEPKKVEPKKDKK
ncbi:MAG: hypothetical protein K8U57_06595 [Planctomycetes bacterium]|nr:hypothetical protein [Planctomycetota bacterium]